jgi:hypothetical protein
LGFKDRQGWSFANRANIGNAGNEYRAARMLLINSGDLLKISERCISELKRRPVTGAPESKINDQEPKVLLTLLTPVSKLLTSLFDSQTFRDPGHPDLTKNFRLLAN